MALDSAQFLDGTADAGPGDRASATRASRLPPLPCKAARDRLDDRFKTVTAFNEIVRGALEQLYLNEAPTLRGDPGGLHQTRVAFRRLRAALRAFKTLLRYDGRKAFNGEFRWFQQRLSPARDWHVFVDETYPKIVSSAHDRTRLREVEAAARRAGRMANRGAIDVLRSRRYTRLILRFEAWLEGLPATFDTRAGNKPVTKFARSVLRKTRRDLFALTRSVSRLSDDQAHAVRIRGKKARYGAEFFSQLFRPDEARPYIKSLQRLQDKLGDANDAAVARHLMSRLGPGEIDPQALIIVDRWAEQRKRSALRAAQPSWRALARSAPFWEE